MRQAASDAGRKALALIVLLLAAWILFKVILGFVTAAAGVVVIVIAVVAIVWAIRVL